MSGRKFLLAACCDDVSMSGVRVGMRISGCGYPARDAGDCMSISGTAILSGAQVLS